MKKHSKEQSVFERKIDKSSRDNSPAIPKTSLSQSKSAKRLFENSVRSDSLEKMSESRQNILEKSRENLNR